MSGQAGLHYALRRIHSGENTLAEQLLEVAARHRTEHEVYHVARDLAAWSADHVAQVADLAAEHDLDLDADPDAPSWVNRLREALSSTIGRRPEPGLLLIEDLRELYLLAAENSLAWEMLGQHAQAAREPDVLELVTRCHPQTLRQVRWANTMIKTLSPQVLSSL
jgi:hypothetical protein